MSISNQLKQEIQCKTTTDLASQELVERGLSKMSKAKQFLLWVANLLPKPHTQFEITFGSNPDIKSDQDN